VGESKGTSGAGIQYTGKGPVQGISLIASDGRPYDLVVDGTGKRRLAVDSAMTLAGNITIDLSSNTDSVAIGNVTGNDVLFINGDGSIDTRLMDGSGNAITSTSSALDVNIKSGSMNVGNFPTEYPLSAAQISTLTPPAAITGYATSAKQLADGHNVTAKLVDSTSTALDLTSGGQTGVKVMVVGDGDKYCRGVTADDASGIDLEPVIVGGIAVETDGTDPTSVSAEGDNAYFRTDRNRRLLVNPCHPNAIPPSGSFYNATSAKTKQAIVGAPGSGLSLYIKTLIISNGATSGNLYLVEDTAGTGAQITQTFYVGVEGGFVVNTFDPPLRVTANKDLGFTSTTMTTHSVGVRGYIAP
jgi:hypothetical protein